MPTGIKFEPTAQQLRWLAGNYHCTSNAELCAALGIRDTLLHSLARRLGLRKSAEYMRQMRLKKIRAVQQLNRTPEGRAAMSEKKRRLYKSERRRVLFGLPQRTKMKAVAQSRHKVGYRYGMRRKGYVELPGEHNVLRYPSEEMRRPLAEAGAARHGIKILPLDVRPVTNSNDE